MRKKSENFKIVGQWDKTHNYKLNQVFSLSHFLSHFKSAWDSRFNKYGNFRKSVFTTLLLKIADFDRPIAELLVRRDSFRANCVK